MSDIKHSPLPWVFETQLENWELDCGEVGASVFQIIVSKDGGDVFVGYTDETNAKFIVRACNSHYELIGALENCRYHLKELYNNVHDGDPEYTLIQEANSVLSKAKGESND